MILMDTCVFIWDALQNKKLSSKAKRVIQQAHQKHQLAVCDISLWEVAMLTKKQRLQLELPATRFCQLALQARNIELIAISPDIAELSVSLDNGINNDPADRLIAATTIHLKATLVTADQNLLDSPLLATVW